MTRSIILRMNRMAEMRDPKETGPHVNRVAGYAAEIYDRWAFNRGIPEKERERTKDTLKMAAMLHDVGKVAISDLILKKPARFTPEEYKIMQAHTCFGAKLFVDSQSELDKISAEVALRHHENWDGTGYPGMVDICAEDPLSTPLELGPDGGARKLKGEEIPLGGRIVSVADVYDALISQARLQGALGLRQGLRRDPRDVGHQIRSRDRHGLLRDTAAHRGDPQPLSRRRGRGDRRPRQSGQGRLVAEGPARPRP